MVALQVALEDLIKGFLRHLKIQHYALMEWNHLNERCP
jgi:hypothetical protein